MASRKAISRRIQAVIDAVLDEVGDFEDALTRCHDLTEDDTGRGSAEDLIEVEGESKNAAKRLLETGRDFASALPAYAALRGALQRVAITTTKD